MTVKDSLSTLDPRWLNIAHAASGVDFEISSVTTGFTIM
jgi:hypothetical protein